uniref:Uncharacterized protein n=1 Tax=Rheinheimera sp. BAL341 TaxID=1708203 RepID=A0A486XHN6_9GAMM
MPGRMKPEQVAGQTEIRIPPALLMPDSLILSSEASLMSI